MTFMRGMVPFWMTLAFGTGFGLAGFGRRRRAYVWIGAALAAVVCCIFTVWMLPVAVAIHVGSAVDAFVLAARDDRVTFRWMQGHTWGITLGLIAVALLLRTFVIEAFRIPASSMSPTLVIGDHLFIDKVTPAFRPIGRGDIVVFEWPCNRRFDYIKRVVAVGGDTVEVRCDVLYVNGDPAPQKLVDGTACTYLDGDVHDQPHPQTCSRYEESLGGHTYQTLYDRDRPTRVDHSFVATTFPRDPHQLGCADGESSAPAGRVVEQRAPLDVCAPRRHYVVPDGTVFVLGDNRANSNDSRYWGVVPVDHIKGRAIGIWLSNGPGGIDWSRFGAIE